MNTKKKIVKKKHQSKKSIQNNHVKYFSKLHGNFQENIFIGNITTQIIDIDLYGNLKLYGKKKISVNNSYQNVQCSGIVNPNMINVYHSVPSTLISNLNIKFLSKKNYTIKKNNWIKKILSII